MFCYYKRFFPHSFEEWEEKVHKDCKCLRYSVVKIKTRILDFYFLYIHIWVIYILKPQLFKTKMDSVSLLIINNDQRKCLTNKFLIIKIFLKFLCVFSSLNVIISIVLLLDYKNYLLLDFESMLFCSVN